MKQSLEKFVYEVIRMNFKKLGEEILNPNNWNEVTPEEQKRAYEDAWFKMCDVHGSLFNLMNTIEVFKELKDFLEKEESK